MHHDNTSAVPEDDTKQYVALAIEATRLRPRRTTGGTEHSYIWTTEHHLAAAAEASAETSIPLQVTILLVYIVSGGYMLKSSLPSWCRSQAMPMMLLLSCKVVTPNSQYL